MRSITGRRPKRRTHHDARSSINMSLKIEAGKYYRMRNGGRAYVDSVVGANPFNPDKPDIFPIKGFLQDRSASRWNISSTCWTSAGRYCTEGESDFDLVAEWREPLSVDKWFVVTRDHSDVVVVFKSKEAAERWVAGLVRPESYAVIRVTGTEEV